MGDSYCSYVKIFQDMVCKYHSELKQEIYYYEQDNVFVSLVIGEEGESMLKDFIEQFCSENPDKYEYREKYSGKFTFGKTCCGIVVKNGFSYMDMMMELTRFLDEQGFDDENLEMSNTAVDELAMDIIVYFPYSIM